jgi:hypothetical protein
MSEISVYQFLNREESRELVGRLNRIGINAKSQIMTSGEGDLDINEVKIDNKDLEKANKIIEEYRTFLKSKVLQAKYTCSKCKSVFPYVEYKKNVSLIRRFFSFGTKIIECKRCGHEWYI